MRKPRRFDNDLMTPPDALGEADAALPALLKAWCEGGAFPVLLEPLRVASIAPRPGLDHAACELDGTHELARIGRWRGLLWRLQLLARECLTDGSAQARDPWDCGWWREGALAAAESFEPRRATLLMVREADPAAPAAFAALLSVLRARSSAYAKPVRVLVVSDSADGCVSIRPSA